MLNNTENCMSRPKKSKEITQKIGITQRFNFEDTKQTSQIIVELKEATYGEVLLRRQNFILGIWIPLKVFTDLYCLF